MLQDGTEPKAPARRVVAVIVHHGDRRRTIRAVVSHWELGMFSDVIVIANDRQHRPDELTDIPCKWIIPERNIGFGCACQLGAMTSQADVYAFFNAHVTIDKHSLDRCIAAFDEEEVGIASPFVYYPRSAKSAINWKYTYCLRTYSRVLGLPVQVPLKSKIDNKIATGLLDNDWATGGAIFCRSEVIRDVGWDGSYFLGFEDVDISMRAKNKGWRVVVVPSATAFHTGESTRTLGIAAYYAARNQLWFARKHRDRRAQVLITTYLLLLLCRIAAADLMKGRRPPHARPATRGILDGWLLLPDGTEALLSEPLWSS